MAQSSAELIDRLAKQPIQVKAGILVGVLLLLSGVYYYFFYMDMSAEKETLANQKKKLVDDERKLINRQTRYQELLKRRDDAEDRLKKNRASLPESSELPAFFQHLETQAATANVKILSRNIDKETPIESYVKVPVNVTIEGDFYQINHYFTLLAETTRIISIENLKIFEPHKDGDKMLLKAKFTAVTFRQADKPAQAQPVETAAPGPTAPPQPTAGSGGTPPPPPTPTTSAPGATTPPPPTTPTPPAPAPAASGKK